MFYMAHTIWTEKISMVCVEILSRASVHAVTHINIVTQHYLCTVKDNLNIVLVQ